MLVWYFLYSFGSFVIGWKTDFLDGGTTWNQARSYINNYKYVFPKRFTYNVFQTANLTETNTYYTNSFYWKTNLKEKSCAAKYHLSSRFYLKKIKPIHILPYNKPEMQNARGIKYMIQNIGYKQIQAVKTVAVLL